MSSTRNRIILVVTCVLLAAAASAAFAWSPLPALLSMDRTEVDLDGARQRVADVDPVASGAGGSPTTRLTPPSAPITRSTHRIPDSSPHPDTSSAGTPATTSRPGAAAAPSTTSALPGTVAPAPLDEDLVVLLVGSDARPPYDGARADVVIVAHAPADPDRPATLVSLPRDMVVEVPCFGEERINAALNGCDRLSVSGLELLALTVEDWAGLRIDHVAAVDFDGFEQVVDAVGGYPVCLETPIRDDQAHLELPAGCRTLDGAEALGWMRTRSPERQVGGEWRKAPVSDLERTERQRDLLMHVLAEVRDLEGARPLAQLAEAVAGSIVVDSGWPLSDMIGDALAIRSRTVRQGAVATDPYSDDAGRYLLRPVESYDETRARIAGSGS